MKAVYLFTGPVKSGKSSRLYEWIKTREDVAGILSLMIGNKKHLYSISQKQSKCLESHSDNIIHVGRYQFDPDVFNWARTRLSEDLKTNPKVLIIDELGPLEINGKGLDPAVSNVLSNAKDMSNLILIFVVRASLVAKVQEFFKLEHALVIDNLQEIAQ
jgi:nucleoside-triphosphatase THEP1